MLRLISVIVGITVHRRGPDELPASPYLGLLLLGASGCAQLEGFRVASAPDGIVMLLLSAVALDFLFVWTVLAVFERRQRFWQTMNAVLGAGVVLNVIGALLAEWNESLNAPPTATTVPYVLLRILQVWSVDIGGFVLSRAIGRHYALAVAIMLGYVLLSTSLLSSLLLLAGV